MIKPSGNSGICEGPAGSISEVLGNVSSLVPLYGGQLQTLFSIGSSVLGTACDTPGNTPSDAITDLTAAVAQLNEEFNALAIGVEKIADLIADLNTREQYATFNDNYNKFVYGLEGSGNPSVSRYQMMIATYPNQPIYGSLAKFIEGTGGLTEGRLNDNTDSASIQIRTTAFQIDMAKNVISNMPDLVSALKTQCGNKDTIVGDVISTRINCDLLYKDIVLKSETAAEMARTMLKDEVTTVLNSRPEVIRILLKMGVQFYYDVEGKKGVRWEDALAYIDNYVAGPLRYAIKKALLAESIKPLDTFDPLEGFPPDLRQSMINHHCGITQTRKNQSGNTITETLPSVLEWYTNTLNGPYIVTHCEDGINKDNSPNLVDSTYYMTNNDSKLVNIMGSLIPDPKSSSISSEWPQRLDAAPINNITVFDLPSCKDMFYGWKSCTFTTFAFHSMLFTGVKDGVPQ